MRRGEIGNVSVEQLEKELRRERHRRTYRSTLWSTISALLIVAAIAVLVSMLWIPVLQIVGESMTPALYEGEIIVAPKGTKFGKGDVIGGFAGATADAFTLFERLEAKLEQYPGQLTRAAVELAKDWRTDRYLRRLEAMMIVADKDVSLVLTGTGDVLEPEHGVMAIGSGGNYALAAARALADSDKDAETIVRRALDIAADICVYTNRNVTIETLTA